MSAILTKSVAQVVAEWRWKLTRFIFAWIVIESLGSMEKWPSITLVFLLAEKIVGVVGDLLVECSVHGEALALRKGKASF